MNSSVASWPFGRLLGGRARPDHHSVGHGERAAGLELRDPLDLDEAHAARADGRPEPRLVAEHRDLDPRGLRRLDEAGSLGHLDLAVVDGDGDELRHAPPRGRGARASSTRREDPLERRLAVERAAAQVDVRLVLVAEPVDVAEHRDRVGVAERAEALAHDPVADREEQVEIGLRPAAVLDLLEDLRHPARSHAARRALPARLVLVELRDADPELHHAAAVVDDDHARRADRGAGLDERGEVHRRCRCRPR